jgi:hypothetical protein
MDHGWDRETPIFNALLHEWRGNHRAVPAIESGSPTAADGGPPGPEHPITALTRLLPGAPEAGPDDGRPSAPLGGNALHRLLHPPRRP